MRYQVAPMGVLAAAVVLAVAVGFGNLLIWALDVMPLSFGPVLR